MSDQTNPPSDSGIQRERSPTRPLTWIAPALVAAAAVVMGWPALRGEFLSGDDLMLILRMPLVSDPSLKHGLQIIFTIGHADLYQPVPLLSFSWDFLVAGWLGISPDPEGSGQGATWFHLTNVLLHAANGVLLWTLLRSVLQREAQFIRDALALLAAFVFVLHPMNVESVAWLNGRMTLLACGFEIAALLAAARLLDRWSLGMAFTVIGLAILATTSKVRVEFPVLLLLLPLIRHVRPSRRWWAVWGAGVLVTAIFTLWNYVTTEAMVQSEWALRAGMTGARVARIFQGLGWYLTHVFWPQGLSPWYPPHRRVYWSDGATLLGIILTALTCAAALWLLRFSRIPALGVLWFLAGIAPTLPLQAVRRAQAADRYTYLANVGLYLAGLWCVLVVLRWVALRWSRRLAALAGAAAWATVASALLLLSWRTAAYYRNNLARDQRIAALFPNEPGVWEKISWVYFREGGTAKAAADRAKAQGDDTTFAAEMARAERSYDQAIALALYDARQHPERMTAESLQVVGMAHLRLGRPEEAIRELRDAVEANPRFSKGYFRLGQAYEETGQPAPAVAAYERSVQLDKAYTPAESALANLYRQVGRLADAERLYLDLLSHNQFDVASSLALSEIRMQTGRFAEAKPVLERLLAVLPEHTRWTEGRTHARTNLGACLVSLGDIGGAVREYEKVLAVDPGALQANLNLAMLLAQQGHPDQARALLESAPLRAPQDPGALATLCDTLVSHGAVNKARGLLEPQAAAEADVRLAARRAWLAALGGQWENASLSAERVVAADPRQTLAAFSLALAAMARGEAAAAVDLVANALAPSPLDPPDAAMQLLIGLGAFAESNPEAPWPYYLAAMVSVRQGNAPAARMSVDLFKERCPDETWRARAEALLATPEDHHQGTKTPR